MNDIPEDWAALLQEFEYRKATAHSMGGTAKLEKRRATGKPNARQFIEMLVDPGSFFELGTLVGSLAYSDLPPANCDALVGGIATINGRQVVIGVEDFTVQGGSIGHGTNAKRLRLATLAKQERVPYLMILDGAGARMTNALERHPYAPGDLQVLAEISGLVPTVAVVLGSSAGHGALTGLLMDFLIMLEDATLFSAGPPLVAAALGEIVSKEDLGGAHMHASRSGVAHNLARDADHACCLIRDYLGFLPANAWGVAELTREGKDVGERRLESILSVVPRNNQKPYDIRKVINLMADEFNFFEFQPLYGKTMVCGLIRLGGQSMAVVANQPMVMAGAIDHTGAAKAAHFIDIANAYHLPVVFLADNPGIMSGTQAEQSGNLRAAARMYMAQAKLTTPKLHVTLRKAFGFGSSIMAMNPFDRQTLTLAFPGISLGGIPVLGGGDAAKVDATTQETLAETERQAAWATADNMAFDEIIDPRDLRNALLRGLALLRGRLQAMDAPTQLTGIRP